MAQVNATEFQSLPLGISLPDLEELRLDNLPGVWPEHVASFKLLTSLRVLSLHGCRVRLS